MPMPSNSFVFNSHWSYPAVQYLTASAGGGGKGIPSSPVGDIYIYITQDWFWDQNTKRSEIRTKTAKL